MIMMMTTFFLIIGIFIFSELSALNNPFSCTRAIIHTTKIQSHLLKNFKFLGIVGTNTHRQALVLWEGNMHTLLTGNTLGPIKIAAIYEKTIRIIAAKKEYILTLDSE